MAFSTRFNIVPLFRGHVRTLSVREPDRGEQDSYPLDRASLGILVVLPAAAWVAASILAWRRHAAALDPGWIGVIAAASTLLSAALLGAFSLLGQWRSRLNERAHQSESVAAREWPVRALIDEAVTTTLVGVFDSVLVILLALVGGVLHGWVLWLALGAMIGAGVHLGLLFLMLVVCLYSAYTQSEDVPEALDGHM